MFVDRRSLASVLALAATAIACNNAPETTGPRRAPLAPGAPLRTTGSGTISTLLGRATFQSGDDPRFRVKRQSGAWTFEMKSNSVVDVAVQTIDFQPGGYSGWHSHPGPVLIQVVTGEMTFYESDDPSCTPHLRRAGESYLDVGDHAHFARNETATNAQNVVTYFAPKGATLRIDEPSPGNCPF